MKPIADLRDPLSGARRRWPRWRPPSWQAAPRPSRCRRPSVPHRSNRRPKRSLCRPRFPARASHATSPRAYRADAASHLYGLNQDRIYKGRLPPLLYAIGVLQVEVDGRGHVRKLDWMRAPKHAPEVVAEIERTVRAAAPFPAPARMGKVVYTDTWLWHKSGRFQLDTLTEGRIRGFVRRSRRDRGGGALSLPRVSPTAGRAAPPGFDCAAPPHHPDPDCAWPVHRASLHDPRYVE